MAWHLYRLGKWSFTHRRIVTTFWVMLLVLMGVGSATLSGKTSDQFSLPGIESTQAFDLIEERSPGAAPDGATARIVYQAPEGETLTSDANEQAVLAAIEATRTDHVVGDHGSVRDRHGVRGRRCRVRQRQL